MGVREHVLAVDEAGLPHLPLFKLGPKESGRAIITSTEFYEVDTHFVGRRTLPCLDQDCLACQKCTPLKYEGYVGVIWVKTKRHQILRLTKPAMLQLKSQLRHALSPRGTAMFLERKGSLPNGRIEVHVEPNEIEMSKLPESPNLPWHLAKIWRIDGIEVASDERAYVAQLSTWIQAQIDYKEQKDAAEEKACQVHGHVAG